MFFYARPTARVFTATDPDKGDSHSYSLVSGPGDTDNTLFTIDGNTLKALEGFDYETKSTFSIRVSVSDKRGEKLPEEH